MKLPNIPTALTAYEAETLHRLAKGKTVVEIGSLLGFSTVVMAQAAEFVTAIDPHEGYPERDPRPTYPEFIQNLERFNVWEKVVPIRTRVQNVRLAGHGWLDMAFIDASGKFNDTLDAILSCDRWLRPGGILAVHDYGLDSWPGATQAIDAWSRIKGRPFRLFDTLAVFMTHGPDCDCTPCKVYNA